MSMDKKIVSFVSSQIKQIRAGGFPVFFSKAYTFFLMLLAVPIVLLVRLLRPLVVIRFGSLQSRRIGHFLADTEVYLLERDAGRQPPRTFDIFYHYLPISNFQVKKMLERIGKLHISPFTTFTQIIDRVNRLLPGGTRHVVKKSDVDLHSLRAHARPYLSLTTEEEELGRRQIQRLGIANGNSFICFHARDPAYLDAVYPNYKWRYQDFRDSNIDNYLPAAEEMTRRGYYALRMGAVVKNPLNSQNPSIIDYAVKARTEFLDVYLGAKCRFFICDGGGISTIPMVFRRPIVLANYVHISLRAIAVWGACDLLIPKKFWSSKEHRFLSLREILDSDIETFSKSEQYKHMGIELIENTPEEITAVTVEMDERLKGTWQAAVEDEQLQQRFLSILRVKQLNKINLVRIGAEFLRNNQAFLE